MKIIRDVRRLPRLVQVLIVTNAISAFGSGLVLPFLWVYLHDARGMKPWVPAVVLTVQAVAAFIGSPVWGAMFDRLAYRIAIPGVMVLAAIGTAMFALAVNPGIAVASGALYGAGISGVGTAMFVMYGSQSRTDAERVTAFSVDFGLLNAFGGLGALAGGVVVAVHVGHPADRFALLYLIDGISFLFTAAVAAVMLKGHGRPGERERRSRRGYAKLLRSPWLVSVLSVLLLQLVVTTGQMRSAFPGYLTARGAVGAPALSVLFTVNIVVVVITQFLIMPRLSSVRHSRLLAVGGVLAGVSWALIFLAGGSRHPAAIALAAVAVALLGVAETIAIPQISALINNTVEESLRGRANALLTMALTGSNAIGPVITGVFLGLGADGALMAVLVGLSAVSVLIALRLRQMPRPEPEPARVLEPADR